MRYGYTVIEVLPFLNGLLWDELAKAYVHALRPSEVRTSGECMTSDAKVWRVTVTVDSDGHIKRIEQEVDVMLPDGIEHGHALDYELHRRRLAAGTTARRGPRALFAVDET